MKKIVLTPFPPINSTPGFIRNECILEWFENNTLIKSDKLWFEHTFIETDVPSRSANTFLLAVLMDAMKAGMDIHVKAKLSNYFLSNLNEFQRVWQCVLPDIYKVIGIEADSIDKSSILKLNNNAISAYSGGVDATFTIWAHLSKKMGHSSKKLTHALFVSGYDIDVNDTKQFDTAFTKAQETLNDVDITLLKVSTNLMAITNVNWEHLHGAAIAAAMHCYSSSFSQGLIGSGSPYDAMNEIPWGSSPITDHLLSSEQLQIIHDGAAFSRIDKVNIISKWEAGSNNLRVCWQQKISSDNCGQCEKCLRTMANFWASNKPIPHCFPNVNNWDQRLNNIILKSVVTRYEWTNIKNTAIKNSCDPKIIKAIQKLITSRRLSDYLLPQDSKAYKHLKSIYYSLRGIKAN